MFSLSLILKSGLAISSLTAIPLITKKLIDSVSSKHVVHESGSLIGPIFDCYKDKSNYRVYLVPNTDNWSGSEDLDKHINLRIVEKQGNNPEQVVWETNGASNKWSQWDIHFLTKDKVKLLNGVLGAGGFEGAPTCSNIKVDLKNEKSQETFWSVSDKKANTKTKFKVDLKVCEKKEECDIIFAEDSQFQWSSGFQPKIAIPLKKR